MVPMDTADPVAGREVALDMDLAAEDPEEVRDQGDREAEEWAAAIMAVAWAVVDPVAVMDPVDAAERFHFICS